jgi:uncharacterized membrane protein YhaH (DUF805 family)
MEKTYTATPQVEFIDSIKTGFNHYTMFTGRARRSEYWFWTLFTVLLNMAASALMLNIITSIAVMIPSYAVTCRRLHDTGRSGWWVLAKAILDVLVIIGSIALLVVLIGLYMTDNNGDFDIISKIFLNPLVIAIGTADFIVTVIIFIFTLQDSDVEANEYGESPKYVAVETEEGSKPENSQDEQPVTDNDMNEPLQ